MGGEEREKAVPSTLPPDHFLSFELEYLKDFKSAEDNPPPGTNPSRRDTSDPADPASDPACERASLTANTAGTARTGGGLVAAAKNGTKRQGRYESHVPVKATPGKGGLPTGTTFAKPGASNVLSKSRRDTI